MLVDDATVFIQQLHWDSSLGGRSRHGEAALHVFDDLQCRAADWDDFAIGLWLRFRSFSRRRSSSGGRTGYRRCHNAIASTIGKLAEIGTPGVVDEFGVIAEALEKRFDIGGISAEFFGDCLRQIGCILLTQSGTSVI